MADTSGKVVPNLSCAQLLRSTLSRFTNTGKVLALGAPIRLMPVLILYTLIFLAASRPTLEGDEPRYAEFATNLTHGYYSDRHSINLWNGPGYPLVLYPFALLQLPWQAAKLLNVFFLFGALVYFYRTLQLYMKRGLALRFAYLLGLFPPFLASIHLLMTECFASFLVCAFSFYFCKLFLTPGRPLVSLLAPSV